MPYLISNTIDSACLDPSEEYYSFSHLFNLTHYFVFRNVYFSILGSSFYRLSLIDGELSLLYSREGVLLVSDTTLICMDTFLLAIARKEPADTLLYPYPSLPLSLSLSLSSHLYPPPHLPFTAQNITIIPFANDSQPIEIPTNLPEPDISDSEIISSTPFSLTQNQSLLLIPIRASPSSMRFSLFSIDPTAYLPVKFIESSIIASLGNYSMMMCAFTMSDDRTAAILLESSQKDSEGQLSFALFLVDTLYYSNTSIRELDIRLGSSQRTYVIDACDTVKGSDVFVIEFFMGEDSELNEVLQINTSSLETQFLQWNSSSSPSSSSSCLSQSSLCSVSLPSPPPTLLAWKSATEIVQLVCTWLDVETYRCTIGSYELVSEVREERRGEKRRGEERRVEERRGEERTREERRGEERRREERRGEERGEERRERRLTPSRTPPL